MRPLSSVADRFTEGYAAQQAGNLEAAEKAYRDVLKNDQSHYLATLNLGVLLAGNKGRIDEAIQYLRAAIRLQPDDPYGYSNLANTLRRSGGQKSEIEALYMRALLLSDDDPSYLSEIETGLGLLHAESGDRERAEVSYRLAAGLDRRNAVARHNLGVLLSKVQGREIQAAKWLVASLEIEKSAETYEALGETLSKRPELQEKAMEMFQKAIQIQPDYAEAYEKLAELLSKDKSRRNKAEEYWLKAQNLYEKQGQDAKAKEIAAKLKKAK